MNPRPIAFFALLTLLLSLAWLVLMIAGATATGPIADLDHMILTIAHPHWSYTPGYINAAILTLLVTVFYTLLYHTTHSYTGASMRLAALLFVPVYCVLNLIAYLTQLTLVPALIPLVLSSASAATGKALLAVFVHTWPGSVTYSLNALAYAILGIPSIIFGIALSKLDGLFRSGGFFLALNGFACIVGIIGVATGSAVLANGVVIGGVLFILALALLTLAFFRLPAGEPQT